MAPMVPKIAPNIAPITPNITPNIPKVTPINAPPSPITTGKKSIQMQIMKSADIVLKIITDYNIWNLNIRIIISLVELINRFEALLLVIFKIKKHGKESLLIQ